MRPRCPWESNSSRVLISANEDATATFRSASAGIATIKMQPARAATRGPKTTAIRTRGMTPAKKSLKAGTVLNSASKMPTTDMTARRAWGTEFMSVADTVPLTAAASGAEAVRVAACRCSLFAGRRAVQSGGEAGGERSSSKSSSVLRLRSTPVPKSKTSSPLAGGEDDANEEAWKEGGASGGGCVGRPEDSSGCGCSGGG
mmetsp:Transcript_5364/g.17395  ORF Transcript_5364/g.17395 Transcript_5364/m.17395 type:complete len:201 (-) Transcript_5364:19-621(-)